MENFNKSVNHSLPLIEIYRYFPDEREAWDNIVESSHAGIYLTYDWCKTWWAHYNFDRELRIFLIYEPESHQLIGMMPMFIDKVRVGLRKIRIAKTLGADFTIGTCEPPILPEWKEQVFTGIISELIEKDRCDAILIGPLVSNESLLSIKRCANRISRLVKFIKIQSPRPHTIFELPGSFDGYMMSLGKSTKKNYRERWNRLRKRYDVSEDIVMDPEGEKNAFTSFIEMHTEQWAKEDKLGHFGDWPHSLEFHKDLAIRQARRGRFRLPRLFASGTVINYQYAYAFGDTLHWLLPARIQGDEWDNLALGRIGLVRMFAWAINEGFKQVDAGPGHYSYKLQLGAKEIKRQSILIVQNNLGSRWRCLIYSIQGKLLNLIYYRIWFSRVAPKFGIRGVLWKSWIRRQLS